MTARLARTGTALVIAGIMVAACQTARLDNIAPQSAAPLPPPSSAQTASTTATETDATATADAATATSATTETTDASLATTAAAQPETGRPPPGWPPPGAARNTGTYPNLNVPPPVATEQITDSEESASKAELNALKQRAQGTRPPTVSSQAALRKLGQSRGADVLKEIEASGGEEEAE